MNSGACFLLSLVSSLSQLSQVSSLCMNFPNKCRDDFLPRQDIVSAFRCRKCTLHIFRYPSYSILQYENFRNLCFYAHSKHNITWLKWGEWLLWIFQSLAYLNSLLLRQLFFVTMSGRKENLMLTFCVHSSWKFLLIPPGEQSWSWISQHESSVSIRKLNKTWRFNCLTNLTEWNLVVQRLMWNGIGAFVIVGLSLFWILSNLNMFPICLCCNISFGLVPKALFSC